MSRELNAEETKTSYTEKMGDELGALFYALSAELTSIVIRWEQFRILFAEKPSRIDLLKKAAPFFFDVVHETFFADTLLGIARLLDPDRTMGKKNLSICRLAPLISDPITKRECEELVERAKGEGKFARDWRNRRLAHRDYGLSLNTQDAQHSPGLPVSPSKTLSQP